MNKERILPSSILEKDGRIFCTEQVWQMPRALVGEEFVKITIR